MTVSRNFEFRCFPWEKKRQGIDDPVIASKLLRPYPIVTHECPMAYSTIPPYQPENSTLYI